MRNLICIFFFCHLIIVQVHAITPDSTYVRRFAKRSSISLFVKQKNMSFDLSSDSAHNLTVSYKPNIHNKIGATLSWREWSGSVSVRLPQSAKNLWRKGKTDYWDYSLSMQTRILGLYGNIGQYQGFYISNPGTSVSAWTPGDSFPSRRDIFYNKAVVAAWVILNPKHFSIKSIVQQSELQKRNAGSLSIGINLNAVEVSSDSTLIPVSISKFMPDINGLKDYKIYMLGLDVGYYYTFVKKRFFITPYAGLGVGGLNQSLSTQSGKVALNNIFSSLTGKMFSGFNFDSWFCGFSIESSKLFTGFYALNWNEDLTTIKIQGGIRF